VQKRLRRERGVCAADRTPPEDGHADLGRVKLHRDVGHGIRERGRTFHRGDVDTVLHEPRLEWRSLHDRLPHDAVLPADDVALAIQPGAQAMYVERTIAAALEVVLPRPHDLDGLVA